MALALAFLPGCGGGGGGDGGADEPPTLPPPQTQNQVPVARAGADQTVTSGTVVQLDGSASSDADGTVAGYAWEQTTGPTVTLSDAAVAAPTFTAPTVSATASITLSLTVTDDDGASSTADSVSVIVQPAPVADVTVAGTVTFARVPFTLVVGNGLDYVGTTQQPAREVTLQIIDAATQQVLATGTTDENGEYSLTVAGNLDVFVRVWAEMRRDAPQQPRWLFEVRDVDAGNLLYSYDGAVVNSSAAGAQDVSVPSGWNAVTRQPSGPRHAAPFAILDTVYQARNAILDVAPDTIFPTLVLDWSADNPGGETFYTSGGGSGPRIVLSGQADVDTDEYDQHVIAHEFGHYIEDQFARSDSIGGPHGVGDRLDPRVAFGEGFGYAFAGVVLGDAVSRDSFGSGQASDGFFNMEQNTITHPGWYSEGSVWAILWDLFDTAADGSDDVALGFAPLWEVLTGPQRLTDATTTLFSFVTALKGARPGEAVQIDQVVSDQDVVAATMDEYGSTETNAAGQPVADVLPVYTTAVVDGPSQIVRSIATFGTYNKLSNHRLVKVEVGPAVLSVMRIQAVAPGRDPDVRVFRAGTLIATGEEPADENFTILNVAPGTYILDVYDCDNSECGAGSPAATDITVTVTSG